MTDLDIVEARLERWKKNKELRRLKEQAELMSNAAQNQLRVEQLSSQGTCTMTTRETVGDMRPWPGMRAWFPELAQEALAEQATAADPLAPVSLEEWRR